MRKEATLPNRAVNRVPSLQRRSMTESGGNTVIPSLQRRSMTESGGCAVWVGKKLKCANPRKGRGGKREDARRRRGGCHGGGET